MEQICDRDLLQEINDVKLNILDFKEVSFNNMFKNNNNNIESMESCTFSKWIT
mgnify:CR=1 FL=1